MNRIKGIKPWKPDPKNWPKGLGFQLIIQNSKFQALIPCIPFIPVKLLFDLGFLRVLCDLCERQIQGFNSKFIIQNCLISLLDCFSGSLRVLYSWNPPLTGAERDSSSKLDLRRDLPMGKSRSLFEQLETCSRKMHIEGKNLLNAVGLHENKRTTICKTELLVVKFPEKCNRPAKDVFIDVDDICNLT